MPNTHNYSTVSLPAGAIDYREAGPADGPVVVFIHGFLVDDRLWGAIPERLGEQGIRAIAPRLPLGSHSRPMNADADMSPPGVARTVLDFLAALDLDEVTLVANDSGGAVTQMVLDADASRIARVVFTNCDAFEAFPPFPFDVLFGAARRERVFRGLARAIALAPIRYPMYRILTRRGFPKGLLADWVRPARQIPGVSRDALAFLRGAMAMDLVPISERMTEFPRPVLLCWGTGDRFFTLKLGRRLEATFPDARLVEIQDAWTFVAIDQPERLTALIAEFVQRVGSEPWLSSPSMASTN